MGIWQLIRGNKNMLGAGALAACIAVVVSMAMAFTQPNSCASAAATCPVGSTQTFDNEIGIQGGTAFTITTSSEPTAARTYTLQDNTGAVVLATAANTVFLTTTGATNVTLPLTGTLATLAGSETFTNKTLTSPTINAGALSGTFTGTPTLSGAGVLFTGGIAVGGNAFSSSTNLTVGNSSAVTNTAGTYSGTLSDITTTFSSGAFSNNATGLIGRAIDSSTQAVNATVGLRGVAGQISITASHTVTGAASLFAAAPSVTTATLTNAYGVYVEAITQGGTNYAFRSAGGGIVSIGDTTQSTSATTGSLVTAGGVGISKFLDVLGNAAIGGGREGGLAQNVLALSPASAFTTAGTTMRAAFAELSASVTSGANSDYMAGIESSLNISNANTQAWTNTVGVRGFSSQAQLGSNTYTVTGGAGFYATNITESGSATLTNQYGAYIEALTSGTNNYGIWIATPTGTIAESIHTTGGTLNSQGPVQIGGSAGATANQFFTASAGASSTTMYIGNASIDVTVSDQRLKNVLRSSNQNATAILGNIPIVDFTWKADKAAQLAARSDTPWIGLTAQQLYEILPQFVVKPPGADNLNALRATADALRDQAQSARQSVQVAQDAMQASPNSNSLRQAVQTAKDTRDAAVAAHQAAKAAVDTASSTWSVNYQYMVPYLIKAIQELNARVTALEAA